MKSRMALLTFSISALVCLSLSMSCCGNKTRNAQSMTSQSQTQEAMASDTKTAVSDEHAERLEWLEGVQRRIAAAVERGDLTEEDGRQRLANALRRMSTQDSQQTARVERPSDDRTRASERGQRRVDWDSIVERIENAVERGDITREQADKRLEGVRERMRGAGGRE